MGNIKKIITDVQYNVCIDSIADGDFKGSIYFCYSKTPIEFTNYVSMVKILEGIMNMLNYPQKTTDARTFSENAQVGKSENFTGDFLMSKEDVFAQRGQAETFVLDVTHRQNATWQGKVKNVENNQVSKFKSELELMKILLNIKQS